jgi:hypothetical protein
MKNSIQNYAFDEKEWNAFGERTDLQNEYCCCNTTPRTVRIAKLLGCAAFILLYVVFRRTHEQINEIIFFKETCSQ